MSKRLERILFIEIGTLFYAFAVGLFLLPGNVLSGGVSGIVTLLKPYIGIDSDILVIILNTLLYLIGAAFLGKEFAVNTAIYTASYPIFLILVTRFLPEYEIDQLLAALYGGVIGGIGVGLIFKNGGSSGGTDVIPLILNKISNLEISKGVMILDASTVIAGLFIYGVNSVLIGLLSVFFTTFTIEKVNKFNEGVEANKLEIISSKYQEIIDAIHGQLQRGTTIISAQGGYTENEKKVIMTVVSSKQLDDIKDIIYKIDQNAFVIVSEVMDVKGEGFTFETRL